MESTPKCHLVMFCIHTFPDMSWKILCLKSLLAEMVFIRWKDCAVFTLIPHADIGLQCERSQVGRDVIDLMGIVHACQ